MARLLMLLALCFAPVVAEETAPLRIAAAADLAKALEDLTAWHQAETRQPATVTLGSSGLLARQIAQGAPFDVFFSANAGFIDDLIAQGHGVASSRALYGRGRIVLWTKAEGILPPEGLADLTDRRFTRIAIANPDHAPYGQAARQAMQQSGIWDAVHRRLVYGENVGQTLHYAQTGNAEVAVVALSLAIPTPGGTWTLIDDRLHQPLDQGLMVVATSRQRQASEAFAARVTSPAGLAILRRYGFVQPGETLDPALLERANGRLPR